MQKSLITKEYQPFLAFLKKIRHDTSLTREHLAEKLKTTQSFVSKVERGERRIDVIELRHWIRALGLSLPEFTDRMEAHLNTIK